MKAEKKKTQGHIKTYRREIFSKLLEISSNSIAGQKPQNTNLVCKFGILSTQRKLTFSQRKYFTVIVLNYTEVVYRKDWLREKARTESIVFTS